MVAAFVSTRKLLFGACLMLACAALFWYTHSESVVLPGLTFARQSSGGADVSQCSPQLLVQSEGIEPTWQRKDIIDNSGAKQYLSQYEKLFSHTAPVQVIADPNKPGTITTWWQAAAMIDWYINSGPRYDCKNRQRMGNWHICQDAPFTVKPPCLVYSFGINFDFSFDDDMAKLGCEVHSFDPSMNKENHKRSNHSFFYNMGLGPFNSDGFIARQDMYVKDKQVWKMRTLKHIIRMLGHQNRVIDVLKIDVEGHEWAVLDNLIESGVFQYVRQFMLEFHLFEDFPKKEEYVYIYKTYTQLREMGFQEHLCAPHPKTIKLKDFNNQGDIEYVNVYFERKSNWR